MMLRPKGHQRPQSEQRLNGLPELGQKIRMLLTQIFGSDGIEVLMQPLPMRCTVVLVLIRVAHGAVRIDRFV